MSASYGTTTLQTVPPNQPVAFADISCPCTEGLIFKKGAGVFLLASNAPAGGSCSCGCRKMYLTDYEVEVHLNVQIPEDGEVGEIRMAIALDGVVDPESVMIANPTEVETADNVGTSIIVSVPSLCGCESIAVVNAGDEDVEIVNGSIVFDYAGVRRIR